MLVVANQGRFETDGMRHGKLASRQATTSLVTLVFITALGGNGEVPRAVPGGC